MVKGRGLRHVAGAHTIMSSDQAQTLHCDAGSHEDGRPPHTHHYAPFHTYPVPHLSRCVPAAQDPGAAARYRWPHLMKERTAVQL